MRLKSILKFCLTLCLVFFFPIITRAQTCSTSGYTIATINGIFTDEAGANKNKRAVEKILPGTYHNEPLRVDYLLNNTELGGLGDLLDSAWQKISDMSMVDDYDLTQILNSASEKVGTQKLLIVGYSQGNFYANSFYDKVADKEGGVPARSIGVYSIATPSGRVAGGGRWITSDTDSVIAGLVAKVPVGTIMPPNTHINLADAGEINGHSLTDVYLRYRAEEITRDIYASLDKLQTNDIQDINGPCMEPPKLTLIHKAKTVGLAILDPVAKIGIATVADSANAVSYVTTGIAKTAGNGLASVASSFTIAIVGRPAPILTPAAAKDVMFLTGVVPKANVATAPTAPRLPTQTELNRMIAELQSLRDRSITLATQKTELRASTKPIPTPPPPPPLPPAPSPKAETPKPTASITEAFASLYEIHSPGFGGGGGSGATSDVGASLTSDVAPSEESPSTLATTTAPRDLLAVRGDGTVLLSWFTPNEVEGQPLVTDYDIYQSDNNFATEGTKLDDGVSTATSTLVAGLTNGTIYYFRVLAVNSVGTSSPSNIASAKPATVPGAPTMHEGFTPNTHDGINEVIFDWDAPADNGGEALSGYNFQYSSSSGFSLLDLDVLQTADTTRYTTTAEVFTPDTPNYFRVYAVNTVGTSTVSNITNVSPGIPPPPPPPPEL